MLFHQYGISLESKPGAVGSDVLVPDHSITVHTDKKMWLVPKLLRVQIKQFPFKVSMQHEDHHGIFMYFLDKLEALGRLEGCFLHEL
jgi:hypothetical protein